MISILGVGASKPNTALGNGVYSTLKLEYISNDGNKDVRQALKNTVISSTELAANAAREAMQSAGITVDKIGLVIADCSTPAETIPGESQRTANLLGLKVPAYDLLSGSTSLLNFLNSIKDWKDEKLPDYILYVSVNSPTQRVDFLEGAEKSFFSDAAGALVISSRYQGKFSLQEIKEFSKQIELGALQINLFGHIKLDKQALAENYKHCLSHLEAETAGQNKPSMIISDSHPTAVEHNGIFFPQTANSLGCGIFSVLKDKWESFKKDDTVFLLLAALETKGGGIIKLKVAK